MLTPRIIALSLKKKKKRMSENVLNIPSNVPNDDNTVGPCDSRAAIGPAGSECSRDGVHISSWC